LQVVYLKLLSTKVLKVLKVEVRVLCHVIIKESSQKFELAIK